MQFCCVCLTITIMMFVITVVVLQVAKGARDFLPDQMAIREAAFGTITSVFKRHGEQV
jgi:threonine/homoserine/homoserine lactone efflux protein